jgi:hypothetical protein
MTATSATVFPPLTKGFSFTPSTLSAVSTALPAGETEASVTIGIRLDGDTTHSAGNYSFFALVPAGQTTETVSQFMAAIATTLPTGNYWAAAQQIDTLNGILSAPSAWTAEDPFSIPPTIVTPAPPAAFSAG